jgi:hypothetical protein
MLPSGVLDSLQLTFITLPSILPREIVNRILWYCIAPQELIVTDSTSTTEALATYACSTDDFAGSLPSSLRSEYWRFRHLSWLSVSLEDMHDIFNPTN